MKLLGERQDLYQQEMDKYLVNDAQNIKLSSQKNNIINRWIMDLLIYFEHSKFDSSLSKLWETTLKNRGNISAPYFQITNLYPRWKSKSLFF